MVSVHIKTYGCTANQDNGAIIAGILIESGFNIVNCAEDSDVIIINSCTVKGVTENKIISELRRISKLKDKKIVLAGCMAGAQSGKIKKEFDNIGFVSTQNVTKISDAVRRLCKNEIVSFISKAKEEKVGLPKFIDKKDKAVAVQISEGCVGNCSYCITKLAKGDLFSFSEEKIVADVKKFVGLGVKKIYLTSQDNAAYGIDVFGKSKLAELLNRIVAISGDFEIRVGMMNPQHILPVLDELISVFKSPKVMKFIHIPIQSGSNKILSEMNREYSVNDFVKIVSKFRKEIPSIDVSTDIIVGYPTEKEKDFQETVNLVSDMKFDVLNLSKFASRPGTAASKLKKIPTEEIKRRSVIIHDLYWEQRKENVREKERENILQD